MSKMPAKKKSCFQITSVTQAQVAAIGATDDTESLDDPDESRTEDVSSEIYDMSRAEYEPACDRSSSEEALNNVGEPEASSVVAPVHIPQAGQLPAISNPIGEFRKVGVSSSSQGSQQPPGLGVTAGLTIITQPGAVQQQQQQPPASVSATTSSPAPPPATSTVSCTSRFRVIKLDHGTGEPFRRGRWTCTEFYEKDSDGSKSADSIRHASATVDPNADRDSGLGHTAGSVVAPATHSGQGLSSVADAPLSSARIISVETLPPQQQLHHPNYSARQQGVSGSATQSAFSSSKPTAVPAQQPTVVGLQPAAPQNVLPVGQNGLPQPGVQLQKSPIMPPSSSQPVGYPAQQQQLPMGHHLTSQPSGLLQNQTEYYQQQQQQAGLSTGQSLPISGQGPSSVMPPASGGVSVPSQVGDVAGAGGVSLPTGQPPPALLQQQQQTGGSVAGSILVGGSTLQQQSTSQYTTTAGQPQPHGLHSASSSVQNVPAIAASSSVATTVPAAVPSASSAAMPNVITSSLPPGQFPHSKSPVVLGVQGLPAAGIGQVEGASGRKSEGLINAQSPVVSGKEPVKPFMPESLQLATPTVNSLFGIHIPVDGDEDSASGTNVVAIDNKIEQAMDLVKSHLMYAVREEVEVLKEQIKELFERNSVLERENFVLKSLANSEQLSQLSAQTASSSSSTTPPQQGLSQPPQAQPPAQPQPQPPPQPLSVQSQQPPQSHAQLQHHPKPQQLQTQPQLDPGQQLQPNVTSA